MATSSPSRSRSATTARTDRLSPPSPLSTGLNSRANSAFERTIRPSRSTVASAIGVLWKKLMKRTSAARCGCGPSSRARLSTSWRVVEIIDGVLEFLKHVFLPLEFTRHVGDRPHRQAGLALAVTERAHAHPQPAPGLFLAGAHAHLLLQATTFARCLEQAIDRLGDARIANEDPLDRAHVAGRSGIGEREIGSIGIDDAPAGIG